MAISVQPQEYTEKLKSQTFHVFYVCVDARTYTSKFQAQSGAHREPELKTLRSRPDRTLARGARQPDLDFSLNEENWYLP